MNLVQRCSSFVLLLAGFAASGAGATAAQGTVTSGASELRGRVARADGSPLAGATVLAYHLSSEQQFRSAPTDARGQYAITGLPYGYFDLAVETSGGLYVADVVVNVAPGAKTSVSLTLAATVTDKGSARVFPGAEGEAVGLATVSRKRSGGEFWRSPKGVGILAGLGGAGLLALASGGGGGGASASPSTP